MKSTTFRFVLAIIAAATAFGCTREITPPYSETDPENPQTEGLRTIIVSFAAPTRTTLNGLQPEFIAGDMIKVSNQDKSEERPIEFDDDGNASFTTHLKGPLTAVYPPDAAGMDGQKITGVIIPAEQDGSFAKANICMAENITGNEATFVCKTALFIVTPPEGVETFNIRSLNKIDSGTGQRATEANAAFINTEGSDDAGKRIVTVNGLDTDGKAYVSLFVPSEGAVNLSDLSFEAEKDADNDWIKVITLEAIQEATVANTIAAGTAYTITAENWQATSGPEEPEEDDENGATDMEEVIAL